MGIVKEKMLELRKEDMAEILKRYNVNELSDPKHIQAIRAITDELTEGRHVMPTTAPDLNTNSYLHVIMQQNLIIIDLLDKIANKL